MIEEKEENIPVKSLISQDQKKVFSLIQRLNTIKNEKSVLKKAKDTEKQRIKVAREQSLVQHRKDVKKKIRKTKFAKLSKKG